MSNQDIYIGNNGIDEIVNILNKEKFNRILIFRGGTHVSNSKYFKDLKERLSSFNVVEIDKIPSNPTEDSINDITNKISDIGKDFIIAIGGGSVLDTAKLVNFFSNSNVSLKEYFQNKKEIENLKLSKSLFIPTTMGTGSESTQFATVYIEGLKNSLDHKMCLPNYVILDPIFTMSLPSYVLSCTVADAFCQAVESFWSKKSDSTSQQYSLKAIDTILGVDSNDFFTKSSEIHLNLLEASNYAGRAINLTRTTACHAISYVFTSRFNIPHGHAVALSLIPVLLHNKESKNVQLLLEKLKIKSIEDLSIRIEKLWRDLNLEMKLSKLNIKEEDFKVVLSEGFTPSRMLNNPVLINENDLLKILYAIH